MGDGMSARKAAAACQTKFKPAFRVAKSEKLTKMIEKNSGVIPRLNQGHLMELIKKSWLEAFLPDRNRKAWAQIVLGTKCVLAAQGRRGRSRGNNHNHNHNHHHHTSNNNIY
jgi:hypothetical protein